VLNLRSLRNRLALVFFGVTFIAFGALYMYVAPGLQNRLLDEKLSSLAAAAHSDSGRIARLVGTSATKAVLQREVNSAALSAHDRVTLLGVAWIDAQPQLSTLVDSNPTGSALAFPLAYRSVQTGKPDTGTELPPASGTEAEATHPIARSGRVGGVIIYSSSVSDVVHNVSIVRHEILFAVAIALPLALAGRYVRATAPSGGEVT